MVFKTLDTFPGLLASCRAITGSSAGSITALKVLITLHTKLRNMGFCMLSINSFIPHTIKLSNTMNIPNPPHKNNKIILCKVSSLPCSSRTILSKGFFIFTH